MKISFWPPGPLSDSQEALGSMENNTGIYRRVQLVCVTGEVVVVGSVLLCS